MRLNFQTKPIGHDQVASYFKENYLQKYDMISTIYEPIYNELTGYYSQNLIQKWGISTFYQIKRDRSFLYEQDIDLAFELDDFYKRVEIWNKAVDISQCRIAKIITDFASEYFHKKAFSYQNNRSAILFSFKTELSNGSDYIDEAILNQKEPLEFWKSNHYFETASNFKILVAYLEPEGGNVHHLSISLEEFNDFVSKLNVKVSSDDHIKFVRQEFESLNHSIEKLFETLL